jgi:hypothetical protein
MSTPAHTPTPWIVALANENNPNGLKFWEVRAPNGDAIVQLVWHRGIQPTDEPNAAFIVRACNSHAGLVAALEEAAHRLDILSFRLRSTQRPGMPDYVSKESAANIAADIEREARAALAAAKE